MRTGQICLLLASSILGTVEAQAEGCPTAKDDIATDRPDVTNSSLVVPTGSLQNENGLNFSMRQDGRTFDGTNSRWRLGVAPCLELLVDLPIYFANVQGAGNSGFSDVSPALKWQISPIPGKIDLSVVFGVALPTGVVAIAGRGAQNLQFPWSWELHDGWGVSGMFTEFFRPADFTPKRITETTFVLEKKLTEEFSLFTRICRRLSRRCRSQPAPEFWRAVSYEPNPAGRLPHCVRAQSQCPELYCRRRVFVPLRWIVRQRSKVKRRRG